MSAWKIRTSAYDQYLLAKNGPNRCSAAGCPAAPTAVAPPGEPPVEGLKQTATATAVPRITPEQAAYAAVARLRLTPPKPVIGPSPDINEWHIAAVGYPYWLWAEGNLDPAPVSTTVADLTVSLDAHLASTTFDLGDGTNLTPVESVQVPYLGGAMPWPARFDAAVDGGPLAFGAEPFDHGIGVHAYSRLTFAVDPGWTAFRTQYAIDSRRDAPRLLADVTVRIEVDGKVVHEQQHVRAGSLSSVVRVDLTGARALTLECDYGPTGDTQAHLNWFEPALLRNGDHAPK